MKRTITVVFDLDTGDPLYNDIHDLHMSGNDMCRVIAIGDGNKLKEADEFVSAVYGEYGELPTIEQWEKIIKLAENI